jgi:outer membrane protein TolC
MIGGAAAGVWSELQGAEGRVAQKRATLIDLRAQYEIGKKRLRALASASGKERVLVENGFIKPGERLLLFPKATPKKPGKTTE